MVLAGNSAEVLWMSIIPEKRVWVLKEKLLKNSFKLLKKNLFQLGTWYEIKKDKERWKYVYTGYFGPIPAGTYLVHTKRDHKATCFIFRRNKLCTT